MGDTPNGNGKNGRGWVVPAIKTVTVSVILYVVVAEAGPKMMDNMVGKIKDIAEHHNEVIKESTASLAADRRELIGHVVKALDRTNVVIENNSTALGTNSAKLESTTRALWRVDRMKCDEQEKMP